MTPTARTLKELKELGFEADSVERWYGGKHHDLLGCLDIVACREGIGILGIQTTTGSNHAARRKKMLAEPRLRAWFAAGGRAEIWSWSKRGGRDERKLWQLRREEIKV